MSQTPETEYISKSRTRVLVAEGDSGHALLIKERLNPADFEVILAYNGNECLKYKENITDFDIILVDHNLPDISSLDVIKDLTEKPGHPPLVMFTEPGVEQVAIEAMKLGVYDFLPKSSDLKHLDALVFVVKQSIERNQIISEKLQLEKNLKESEHQRALLETAATFGHEINNPLAAIMGNISLIYRDSGHLMDEQTKKRLRIIEEQSKRIQNIIKRLIHMAQPKMKEYLDGQNIIDLEESVSHEEKIGSRILVIDDESGMRDLFYDILTSAGYKVISASSGEEGLHLVDENEFDLAIVDIRMPKMDGLETFKQMRTKGPNLKVLMTTGFITDGKVTEALKLGAEGCIFKPFDLRETLAMIKNILEEKVPEAS